MGTHINHECYDLNDIISDNSDNLFDDDVRKDAKEFLSKFYLWDKDSEEFDDTPKANYHKYEIKVKQESECCDAYFVDIISVKVMLPTDDDAKNLADILDGEVVSGLNDGCPTFRITYRSEIYIKAKDKEEAESIFRNMSKKEFDSQSEFVEIVSNEKED